TNQRGVEGEGVGVIQADAWHAAGFTGEGLRIGVLDLGFAGYEELLGEDLPENVPLKTFGWYDESEVHGTACAEIVHEVAPGAELVFAWYDGADASFGEAVEWLLAQDVDIITHSAGGVISPRDGTGWDAQVVDEVVAKGILWVNSAGNEADVHHRGTFTDTDGDGYHEFAPGEEMLAVYMWNYLRIYLLWDDNWTRPTQDYDLLIVDEDQNILARADDAQDGSEGQRPAEWVGIESDESVIYIMVQVYESDHPVTFDLFVSGPSAEIVAAVPQYSVTAPGDATGALTVGATEWDDDSLAYYSSQGPTNDERLKPEISAPAGVSGATYGPREFDGTSASTPHVAGAAALVWQAHPEFSRQQVVDFLISASRDLGPTGPDTGYGYGRLLLPPPGDEVIPPVTPGPGPSTTTPSPEVPVTPTSVAFVTPQPTTVLEDDDDEDGGVSLALIGLLIGGMGLGGMGLLLVSGLLFIRSRRAHQATTQPRPSYIPPPPPPSPQRRAGPPDA
ncbi:MAG: S8 family serine peptidase, partial [Anaerolineae bacterium]